MSQCQRILDYLEEHGSITVRQIQTDLCINGATARLSELRSRGFSLLDETVTTESGVRYKVYTRGQDQYNTEVRT